MINKLTPDTTEKILPKLMKKYDISVGYLADRLGVSVQSVYGWSKGTRKPTQPAIDRMKQIFNGAKANQQRKKEE